MKITNTTTEGSKATVALTLSRETLEDGKRRAYAKAKKDIMLPGFRKGHAPQKMVESMYGADVFLEDAMEELFPRFVSCLTDSGLRLVGAPSITKMDKQEDGALALTLEAPLYPEVTLGDYRGLAVAKQQPEVSEEEIDQELEKMADNVSRLVSVEREARIGDTANIDFTGYIDGVAFEGGSGKEFDLKLGEGQFIPGFEEKVVGMNIGDERDIDVVFPEDYQEDFAGKPAVFHVVLHSLKEQVRPAMDDEFVKDVSEYDTMAQLRDSIRARFLKEKGDELAKAFKNAVLDKAIANMQADVPDCMIDEELEYQLKQTAYQLQMNGMTMDQYAQMFGGEDKLRAAMRPSALHQIQAQLLLTKVAEVEAIEASAEEIEAEYQRIATAYEKDIEEVKKRMTESDIKDDLLARKAGDLLADTAVEPEPEAEPAPEAEA